MNLRPYQQECLESISQAYQAGTNRLLEQAKPGAIPYLLQKVRWRGEAATPKQISTLRRLGVPFPENITRGEASILISKFFAVQEAG